MTEIPESISTLVILYIKGEASPSQLKQLKEWASLSVENTIWLNRFNDPEWVMSQIDIFKEAKKEENRSEMWRRIKEEKPKRAITIKWPKMWPILRLWLEKYGVIGLVTTAVAVIILIYCLSFITKQEQPAPATSLAQVNAPRTEVKADISKANQILMQKPVKKPAVKVTRKKVIKKALLIKPFADKYLQGMNNPLTEYKDEEIAVNTTDYPAADLTYETHSLKVPFGGCLQEDLPDGSTCTVSAMSTISYPDRFSNDKRRVEITGRAWFQVKIEKSRPFLVVCNEVYIETTGAEFNVTAYKEENETRVTAIAGQLLVKAGSIEVYLKPGETAIVTPGAGIDIQKENPDKVLAWKKGIFLFDNDSILVVARELARWYNFKLQINGQPQAIVSFTGSRNLSAIEMIDQLSTNNKKIHMRLENQQLIIDE